MASYTDSNTGVIFSDVQNRDVTRKGAGIITTADNVSSGKYTYDPDSDPVVMSLDIDWNGAELGSAIQALSAVPDNGSADTAKISTTSELIKIIAKQQKQIDALIVMMKALYGTFTA